MTIGQDGETTFSRRWAKTIADLYDDAEMACLRMAAFSTNMRTRRRRDKTHDKCARYALRRTWTSVRSNQTNHHACWRARRRQGRGAATTVSTAVYSAFNHCTFHLFGCLVRRGRGGDLCSVRSWKRLVWVVRQLNVAACVLIRLRAAGGKWQARERKRVETTRRAPSRLYAKNRKLMEA